MKSRSVAGSLLWLTLAVPAFAQEKAPDRDAPPQAVPEDADPRVDLRTDEQRREELRGEIPRLEDLVPGLDRDAPQIDLPKEPDHPYPGPGDFLRVFREVPPLIPARPEPQRPPDPPADESTPDAGS